MIVGKRPINIFIYCIFALFIYSLFQRIPHLDDAWLGEQVYWLNKDGVVRNVLMKHYFNNHIGILGYHKLTIWIGIIFTNLFGFSLIALKSVSLVSLIIFLAAFYYYTVIINKIVSKQGFLLVAGLFVIAPHVFEFSFVYRPEIPLMAFSFISFIFLDISRNNKRELFFVIISAIFVGASVLIHLNGLVFISSGIILLLYRKQYKSILIFVAVSISISMIYFVHFNSIQEVIQWGNIISGANSTSLISSDPISVISNLFIRLFNEHYRLFHSPKEITLTIFTILIIIFAFSQLKKQKPGLLLYLLILFLSIAIISINKSSKYSVVYYPYIVLLVIYFSKQHFSTTGSKYILPKNKQSYIFIFFIGLFIVSSLVYDIRLSIQKFSPIQNRNITEKYVLPPQTDKTIVAPMHFIFNELENYKEIISLMSFNERQKTEDQLYGDGFFITANKENIDYLIITDEYWKSLKLPDTTMSYYISNYRIIGREIGQTILVNTKLQN